MARFVERVAALRRLGVGVSTEFGASAAGVDPVALCRANPDLVAFLEIGADVHRGFDADTERWLAAGWPTTYHFLDLNLEEPEDLDDAWLAQTLALAHRAKAHWLCGDAGMWHIGPRDRGHGTLLPPIFCADSLAWMAESVQALRERSGMEVLPENPPANVLVGDLHPLEYFGALAERADCGLLLDVSHLAIVQNALGLRATTLLDSFPVERVVEIHVAGGSAFRSGPHRLIEDDHGPEVLDETWEILECVLARAYGLRAVVVECERNPLDVVVPLFRRVNQAVSAAPGWTMDPVDPPGVAVPPAHGVVDHRAVQRHLFRMLLDPAYAEVVRNDGIEGLAPPASDWLAQIEPELLRADPGDRRRNQLLGNLALEYVHTVRTAPPFLEGFTASQRFHRAIAHDGSLPIAFGAFAEDVLPEGAWSPFLALDRAMAEVRRALPDPPPAFVGRSSAFRWLKLPAGTVAAAERVAAGQDAGKLGPLQETVAVWATGDPGPDRLVKVEVVMGAVAELIQACPLQWADLERFAVRHAVPLEDALELLEQLITDGILVRNG